MVYAYDKACHFSSNFITGLVCIVIVAYGHRLLGT